MMRKLACRESSDGTPLKVCRLGVLLCTALVFLGTGSTLAGPTTTGLVAAYYFDGNANDGSGNGHDGTVYGATLTADRFGNANAAYTFDGIDDYIRVPYADAFQLPVFTMAAWVMPSTDLSAVPAALIAGRGEDFSSDETAGVVLVAGADHGYGHGAGVLYEDTGDDETWCTTGWYPSANTWTHLAVTRALDGTLGVYVNGLLVEQWLSTPEPTDNCFQDFLIGAYVYNSGSTNGLSNFFPGAIDDVMVYGRALSADEIEELAVIPVPSALLLSGIGGGLVSWLRRRRTL